MIRASLALAGAIALIAPEQPPAATPGLTVPAGFRVTTVAQIDAPRELAALPNGDLLVGTHGRAVYIVPDAEAAGDAGRPQVFADVADDQAAGVAFSATRHEVFIGSTDRVWVTAYASGQRRAATIKAIAGVRTGPTAPDGDGDVHSTTSVAFDDATGTLFASVGSSCNACTEADPTRASVLQMQPDGSRTTKRATRIRNAIALTIDGATGALWAGDAGQDNLPFGHPYEFLDDVSAHPGVADYGWPQCEENRHPYAAGAQCAGTVVPRVELPAYSTLIAAAFYPVKPGGAYAFPAKYRGALFVAAHGSWHRHSPEGYASAPQVVYVPMNGDQPLVPVDWNDPNAQWHPFLGGFQPGPSTRIGRPTGLAVGSKGSLFVGDDRRGAIYRIRYQP